MGYTTDFEGEFEIKPTLSSKDRVFLKKLSETRRMGRKGLDKSFGVEGEFFVDGSDGEWGAGQGHDADIIDYNEPPKTQPGLWCGWTPNEEGTALVWDGGEKFYEYTAWLKYLIEKILKPRGYTVNGSVSWQGEESSDKGILVVKKNKVLVKEGKTVYGKARAA
jgi:hypothetical protein